VPSANARTARLPLVARDAVVERPVRLDVRDARARGARDRPQGAELVEHLVGQPPGLHVDRVAPEPREVAVARVRAHRHPPRRGALARAAHRAGVAGVEAARHVRARHHAEQGLVVGERPRPEALAQVRVQVDRHSKISPTRSIDW
jgi:hypothetical protein